MNHTNAGKNKYTWSSSDELILCHTDIGSFQQLPSCKPECGRLQGYKVVCKARWPPWCEVLLRQMLPGNAESPQHPRRSYCAGNTGGTAWDPAPALSAGPQNCSSQPHQNVLVGLTDTALYKRQSWGSGGDFDNVSLRNSKGICYQNLKGGGKMFGLVIFWWSCWSVTQLLLFVSMYMLFMNMIFIRT